VPLWALPEASCADGVASYIEQLENELLFAASRKLRREGRGQQ